MNKQDRDIRDATIILAYYMVTYGYAIFTRNFPLLIFSTLWGILIFYQARKHERTERRLEKYKDQNRDDIRNSQK